MTPAARPPRALARGAGACCLLVSLWLAPSAAPAATPSELYDPLRADETADVGVLLLEAERGDPRAAFLLGTRYASGRGGVRDDSEASRWFRVAAERGLAEAQYNLALMLTSGRGGSRDPAEALRWYEAAGEQGLSEAQFNAAMLHLQGAPGVARDEARGVEWLRKAAERGLARAEFNLGVLSEFGRGVPRDLPAASAWYERAARQGYQPARERLATLRGSSPETASAAVAPAVAPAATTAPAATSADGSAADPGAVNRWVLARDPSRYTLQLFSSKDEEGATAFLRKHRVGDRGGWFRTLSKGVTWYAVVYGDYATQDEARAAASTLPKAFGVKEPWVRNFGALQAAVER